MPIEISTVFNGLRQQQIPALVTILEAGKEYAAQNNIAEIDLIEKRLIDDMHPLRWQVQTVMELMLRGACRLTGAEPVSLEFTDDNFSELIARVKENENKLSEFDRRALDASVDKDIDLPIGPDSHMTVSGENYVVKFLLPNVYFHLTTTYNLLRQAGVPIGKREFMGPVS